MQIRLEIVQMLVVFRQYPQNPLGAAWASFFPGLFLLFWQKHKQAGRLPISVLKLLWQKAVDPHALAADGLLSQRGEDVGAQVRVGAFVHDWPIADFFIEQTGG